MDSACRLCLQLQKRMIPIFSENKEPFDLQSQIKDLCCIAISEDDVMPKSICVDCNSELHSICKFIEQCKQSERQLFEHYKITNIKSSQVLQSKKLQSIGVQTDPCDDSSIRDKVLVNKIDCKVDNQREVFNASVANNNESNTENTVAEIGVTCSEGQNSEDIDMNDESDDLENDVDLERNVNRKIKNLTCPSRTSNRPKFTCDICKKTFTNGRTLLKHSESHTKNQSLTCEYCKKVFVSKGKLTRHTKGHGTNESFACNVCAMPFNEEYKLKCHLRVHGKDQPINTEKPYLCDICSKTFVTKSGLQLHLKIHNGLKPFKCKYCSKTFPICSYKKRHERTHMGDKDFVCHVCSASFASSNGLKYHLMVHTGETKYHCKTCGKSFAREKYLKEHIYTHTGERPFACKICGLAYSSSGSLFVHFRKCKSLQNTNSASTVEGNEIEKTAV